MREQRKRQSVKKMRNEVMFNICRKKQYSHITVMVLLLWFTFLWHQELGKNMKALDFECCSILDLQWFVVFVGRDHQPFFFFFPLNNLPAGQTT